MNLSPETIFENYEIFFYSADDYPAGQIYYLLHNIHTEGQFLPGVRGKGEAENSHAGYEDAGDDEVTEVVESPPAYLDGEGDVQVGGGAALVPHLVPLGWNS